MSRTGKYFAALVIGLFGLGHPSTAVALNEILNIRHWVAPDHTRVVIDTREEATFTVEKGGRRVALDLDSIALPHHLPHQSLLNKPGLEAITLSARPGSGIRVVLSLPAPLQSNVFKLKKFQDKPDRIVVDIVLPDAAKQERDARERIKVIRKSRVVVIDPGHGGEAPGAVGKNGTLEKHVVLVIAKKLRDILNKKEGYRAFLTRDGDYYVSFKKRLMIAREYGADLFVSIHADAALNRGAHGASVYCLSIGAASSEAARILANKENLADAVGGVSNGEGNDASDPIILNMFQTSTINQSRTFGNLLLKELGAAHRLKFATVQEAPFRVLKLPEVPSILIETAYISNDKDEKLLKNRDFNLRMAEGIARSIVEFLPPLPSIPPSAAVSEGAVKPRIPPVEKPGGGEKVAAAGKRSPDPKPHAEPVRKEKVKPRIPSVEKLKRGKDVVAASKKGPAPKPHTAAAYRVKKGDTLAAIAKKHGTTARVLAELNRLKRPDHLYVGRKLRLPEGSSPSKGR